MEKIKNHLTQIQMDFDDAEDRDRINRIIVQRAIAAQVNSVKRQKHFVRLLSNGSIAIGIWAFTYSLASQTKQYFFEGMQLNTFFMVLGLILIVNMLQNLLLILKINRG